MGRWNGRTREDYVRELYERDGKKCRYCSIELVKEEGWSNTETIDHIVPRSMGGATHLTNLVLCCYACNTAKGAFYVEEYIEMIHGMTHMQIVQRFVPRMKPLTMNEILDEVDRRIGKLVRILALEIRERENEMRIVRDQRLRRARFDKSNAATFALGEVWPKKGESDGRTA